MAVGFELAGLSVVHVDDAARAAEAIQRSVEETDVGIILVDDALYRTLPREFLTRIDRQALPILVPVPSVQWDEQKEAEAYILEILRQAIGYRVRLR